MTARILTTLCLALSLITLGCDKPAEEAPATADPAAEAPAAPEQPATAPAAEEAALPPIEVPAAGAKLDPPVKPEQLPMGAYYCDMGTVHWAAMEMPEDGNCPLCGMKLTQKEGGSGAKVDEGDGHAH